MSRVGGVVNTGSCVGVRGGSSTPEPVSLIDSSTQVAPATEGDLKVTDSMRGTLSVCQLYIIKGHVSFLGGASLHTFQHNLRHSVQQLTERITTLFLSVLHYLLLQLYVFRFRDIYLL